MYVMPSISSSSIRFKALVSYLNLNASCLSWMKDFQHHSGRHNFSFQEIEWGSCIPLNFSSISSAVRCAISLNYFSLTIFSSFVTEYLMFWRTLFLKSMASKIFKLSSCIMLSLMSRYLIEWFWVRAEQMCWRPLGPILLFYRFSTSIVWVSWIKWVISMAPLLPSLLSVKSRICRFW